MTKAELDSMTFDEAIDILYDEVDSITTDSILKEFIKEKIDEDDFMLAVHVLNAMWNDPDPRETYYWDYDYSMGTLDRPSSIIDKEDLEQYIYDE